MYSGWLHESEGETGRGTELEGIAGEVRTKSLKGGEADAEEQQEQDMLEQNLKDFVAREKKMKEGDHIVGDDGL